MGRPWRIMTEQADDQNHPQPEYDELAAKQFGHDLRRAIAFREEVFSRDPESAVDPGDAAAVLGLQGEQLAKAIDEGRLGVVEINGERIIRVADLRAAFEEETRRREEFARGWTQLRAELDWDE